MAFACSALAGTCMFLLLSVILSVRNSYKSGNTGFSGTFSAWLQDNTTCCVEFEQRGEDLFTRDGARNL